ncbi:MAG: hypothetical protein JJT94_04435 [Bernardetiaceae bacterium]|nr:hypothetical protein [Bernardetiaceae bacterium]
MTRETYNKRKRFKRNFKVDFDTFAERIDLPIDTIFQAYTIYGKLKFVKITCEFAQIHFDIKECTPTGDAVRFGYRRNSIHKKEIAERIYEGDWKIHTKPSKNA